MSHIIGITDLSIPELGVFVRLTEAQLHSCHVPGRILPITENPKVIDHALDAGYEPVSLLVERHQLKGPARGILARCGDVPLYAIGRDTPTVLTGYELVCGILCAIRRPSLPAIEELCVGARWVTALKGIVDPTNIGAIFHSTAALHMDGVLVTLTCYDPLYRRAVRVSMGAMFQILWIYIEARPADRPQPGLACLRVLGFQTTAMTLSPGALSIEDSRLVSAEKLVIVLGIEGDGLSPRTATHRDYMVCIPMARGVDSPSVAAVSAVASWQLGRYK